MRTVPTFIVGHMSGENWDPPWRQGRDLYGDVWMVARQAWYVRELTARSTTTRRLLSAPTRPSAILYDNDVMAVAGLSVAHEVGVDVPGDLSIVAWDDSVLCEIVHPALTALSRDITAYGAHAAERLVELLDGGAVSDFEDAMPRLATRGSTARAGP